MTRRRWIADRWTENTAWLLGSQAAHLARVLRARPGQTFDVIAGDTVRRGTIRCVGAESVEFSLHEVMESATALPLVLVLSIIRFERFEWAIEKLTELGVSRIVPLIAQRSEKHLVQASWKRMERWQRIMREAAQQSRRDSTPEISNPFNLPECLEQMQGATRLLLSEAEREQSIWQSLSTTEGLTASSLPICAAVGPEGGWTDSEMAAFIRAGWHPVTLGRRILRTETAAIAMVGIVNEWCGTHTASAPGHPLR